MKLILIRHGAVINPFGHPDALYGCLDVELSEAGKKEARRAGEWVAEHVEHIDVVVHSGLKRAKYGAEKVVESLGGGVKIIEEEGFKELDRGEWAGKTGEEISNLHPEYQTLMATDPNFRPESGENYHDLRERVRTAFSTLSTTYPNETLCIVCHNWVIRSFIAESKSLPLEAYPEISVPTASVSSIQYEEFDEEKPLEGEIVSLGVKP